MWRCRGRWLRAWMSARDICKQRRLGSSAAAAASPASVSAATVAAAAAAARSSVGVGSGASVSSLGTVSKVWKAKATRLVLAGGLGWTSGMAQLRELLETEVRSDDNCVRGRLCRGGFVYGLFSGKGSRFGCGARDTASGTGLFEARGWRRVCAHWSRAAEEARGRSGCRDGRCCQRGE